ncbi:2275_t:CDS:1, partial [Acaulospora colombiana]
MLKRTLFATFVAFSLLALCLNAAPDSFVDLKAQLGSDVIFVQKNETAIMAAGKFTIGIKENKPENYFLQFGDRLKVNFKQADIQIK